MSTPSTDDFRKELTRQTDRATRQGRPHVEVNAGELHRAVGGYPGAGHGMPSCCSAMRDELLKGDAEVVFETPSGNGAAFAVRCRLPRH